MSRSWIDAIVAAGAVPAAFVPDASGGRGDVTEVAGADLIEGAAVAAHRLAPEPLPIAAAIFLDGIQRWSVVGYDGVTPIVRAYVAAAARRRGADRRLRTVAEEGRDMAITSVRALRPEVLRALQAECPHVIDLADIDPGQPGRALAAAHVQVDRMREAVERRIAEGVVTELGAEDWFVVDGILSDSEVLATHPRVLGVIKSHGAQYFTGPDLERALTLPAAHRSSVFQPRGHAHHPVYSWYLRLWPWEGQDLLYGLVRIEARAHGGSVAAASAMSAWLYAERAPLATPDARFDRLLYPIHDVETYLRTRAPRDLALMPGSRLPRTGT